MAITFEKVDTSRQNKVGQRCTDSIPQWLEVKKDGIYVKFGKLTIS